MVAFVLFWFGLVLAALAGVRVGMMLERRRISRMALKSADCIEKQYANDPAAAVQCATVIVGLRTIAEELGR